MATKNLSKILLGLLLFSVAISASAQIKTIKTGIVDSTKFVTASQRRIDSLANAAAIAGKAASSATISINGSTQTLGSNPSFTIAAGTGGSTKISGDSITRGTTGTMYRIVDSSKLASIATGATNVTNNNQISNGAGYATLSAAKNAAADTASKIAHDSLAAHQFSISNGGGSGDSIATFPDASHMSLYRLNKINGQSLIGNGNLAISGADSTILQTKYRSDTGRNNVYAAINGKAGVASLGAKLDAVNPSPTGTVTLPSATSIGPVSSTEIGYLDGTTSPIQTQINSKATNQNISDSLTANAFSIVPNNTAGFDSLGSIRGSNKLIIKSINIVAGSNVTVTKTSTDTTLNYSIAATGIGSGSQSANLVFAGPTTGSASPTFRSLVTADIPTIPENGVAGLTTDLIAKAPVASPALTGIPTAPTATIGTNSTQIASTAFALANQNTDLVRGVQALGSSIKAFTFGFHYNLSGAYASTLYNGQITLTATVLPVGSTLTGVKTILNTTGVYTASAGNLVGLYSSSGTTLTLIATSTDDANLWKGTAGSLIAKAFSSTYTAAAGVYYVATMYNKSAETTAPALLNINTGYSTVLQNLDFGGTGFINGTFTTAATSFPATITISSVSKGGYDPLFVAVY